jgi:hypothetical protein
MGIARFLLDLGGGIFVLLGSLHALYTYLDIDRPRRLVPRDPAVARAMAESQVRIAVATVCLLAACLLYATAGA